MPEMYGKFIGDKILSEQEVSGDTKRSAAVGQLGSQEGRRMTERDIK